MPARPELAEGEAAPFTMLVQRALPDGRFVVTNTSHRDVPRGAAFTGMYAERGTLDPSGQVVVHSREQGTDVELRLDEIDFFRRIIECVPCGHHAGVSFDGVGGDALRTFLHAHPRPWLVSLATAPLRSANLPSICERIAAARGGDLVVRIEQGSVATPSDAARLFGLFDSPDIYVEVSLQEAKAVLLALLVKDMAYGSPLVEPEAASELVDSFFGSFPGDEVRCFTNGEFGKPRTSTPYSVGWSPATEHTFDSGVLVLTSREVGCAWFMDED